MKLETPFGKAWASLNQDGAVEAFGFGENVAASGFSVEVETQIREYFAGARRTFSLRLAPRGTTFQTRVWNELLKVPFGTTITYAELARRLGRPNGPRAAGRANATNPISLIIPCHRVLGSNGQLTGYAFGVNIKRDLLEFEREVSSGLQNPFNPLVERPA